MKTYEQIGVECGIMNYIDNETPRRFFVRGDIEENDIEDFARNIANEVFKELDNVASGAYGHSFQIGHVQYSYKIQEIVLHKMGL